MFRFEHPLFLYALLLLPIMWLLHRCVAWQRKRKIARLGNPELLVPKGLESYRSKQDFAFYLALLCIVFALANPQWGTRSQLVRSQGLDVLIALDVSRSMLAEDMPPNRLERMRKFSEGLIRSLAGNRIGLIVFAGSAYLQTPLTADYRLLLLVLQGISPEMLSKQGTDLAAALALARRSFPETSLEAGRALVLISDGEDHESEPGEVFRGISGMKMPIFSLGAGTTAGATIPNPEKGPDAFWKDENGQPVLTRLESASLRQLSRQTRGSYYSLEDDADFIIARIRAEMSQLKLSTENQRVFTEYRSGFPFFLMMGTIFLLLEIFLGARKWGLATMMLFACMSLKSQPGHHEMRKGDRYYRRQEVREAEESYQMALQKKESPKTRYNLGVTVYAQGRYEEAARHFRHSLNKLSESSKRADAAFNMGNALFRKGDLAGSVEAYKQTLRLRSGDQAARHNLSVALRRQQEEKKASKPVQENQERIPKSQEKAPQLANGGLSPAEARVLLDILEEEEKKVHAKLRRGEKSITGTQKAW